MLGILAVETDWDFSIELDGKVYSDMDEAIPIESIEQLNRIVIIGPFGNPAQTNVKDYEIKKALDAIKANPSEYFSNMGGNRGATWYPSK